MRLVQKYMLSEFLKLLAIALGAFVALFLMVDLFENIDLLMKHNVPLSESINFFAWKLPFIIGQVSPVAVLVASLVSLGLLSKHGEITAIKAGGIRLLRAVGPLLFAGLVISVLVILMNEYVTPAALKKTDSFRQQWFGMQGGSFGKEGVWVRTQRGIFNVRQVDIGRNRLYGLTLYELEKPFTVRERIYSRSVAWEDDRWVAETATVWRFKNGEVKREEAGSLEIKDFIKPEDLPNVENLQKNMSLGELRDYVRSLDKDGYDSSKYRIDLYGKITFPLVNFVMLLMGIPFALKTGRHSGIATGVGLSVVIAFSYWIVYAVTRSLGLNALIPPLMAAAFPDVLFFAIGALMFGYVKE